MALEMIDPLIREFERRGMFEHAASARRVKARLLRQQIANAAHDYQRWHRHTNPRPIALIGYPTAARVGTLRTVFIFTRMGSGGCSVARVQGMGITACSTMSPTEAAERAAIKAKTGKKDACGQRADKHGIILTCITAGSFNVGSYKAEWQEEDK